MELNSWVVVIGALVLVAVLLSFPDLINSIKKKASEILDDVKQIPEKKFSGNRAMSVKDAKKTIEEAKEDVRKRLEELMQEDREIQQICQEIGKTTEEKPV